MTRPAAQPSDRPSAATPLSALDARLAALPLWPALLLLRIALAVPFLRSGLTKWDGVGTLSPGAVYLFTEEFRLHLGVATIPYPMPLTMAWVAGAAEIVLPALLVVGLLTRLSALGLFLMTVVIQLTIPEGWANFHLPWAAMALALMALGGGRAAVDAAVFKPR
jgi:putative oxidoreductase